MSQHAHSSYGSYAWQQPGFLDQLDRSLLPAAPKHPAPKRDRKEKDRLFKKITRHGHQ